MVPSLLTTSARVIIDTFGPQIRSLNAHGSIETTNSRLLDEYREYGLRQQQDTNHRIAIRYERIPGRNGDPTNPLSGDITEDLFDEIEAHLQTDNLSVKPDLTVTSFTVRVTEPRLKEVVPAQTPEFDLTFRADSTEDAVRDLTKQRNADRGLYADLGFEIRNLNLRSVEEVAARHHKQFDGRFLSWQGPNDISPKIPERLAARINTEVLPDDDGILKPYVVVDDHMLTIDEPTLDENADTQSSYGGR